VINLNPTPLTADLPSSPTQVQHFLAVLRAAGVNVTLRDTRGQGIDAACGQLRVRQGSSSGPGAIPLGYPSPRSATE
jgi:23S rRNA (adenine2503-C2)-methyltransferase